MSESLALLFAQENENSTQPEMRDLSYKLCVAFSEVGLFKVEDDE
jgi:hypothetical protein